MDTDGYPLHPGYCPNCGLFYRVKYINKFHCIKCDYPIIVFSEVPSSYLPAAILEI